MWLRVLVARKLPEPAQHGNNSEADFHSEDAWLCGSESCSFQALTLRDDP